MFFYFSYLIMSNLYINKKYRIISIFPSLLNNKSHQEIKKDKKKNRQLAIVAPQYYLRRYDA